MKNIHVSQLRSGSFNLTSLVEEAVDIKEDSIFQTHANLMELVGDLENIREGLFFKREKLNTRIRTIQEGLKLDRIDDLNRETAQIVLEPLGTSKDVLERNKEINHLKRMEKAVKYLMEIEKGNFKVLDSLMTSDSEEDWRFLCFLLHNISKVVEDDGEIQEYNKAIEDKMLSVFETGNKQNNKTMMRSAYNSLLEMGKESFLVHSYIYSLDLFKEPVSMESRNEAIIDLDFHMTSHSTFVDLINKIRDTYDDKFRGLGDIFVNTKDVYKIIHKKVYGDIISTALGDYLKGMSPCMFLLGLESCYKNLQILGSFIETIDPDFDGSHATEDLISQYTRVAVDKEKAFFEQIYEVLVLKKKSETRYIILGEEAGANADNIFVYKQLLNTMSFAFGRSGRFYGDIEEDELIDFFARKINGFVGSVYDSTQNKFEVVRVLQFIYLVTRKYFGNKFWRLETFIDKINRKLRDAFEEQIETCSMRIGVRIKQESFGSLEGCERVLEVIRHEIGKATEASIKGENFKILVNRILCLLCSALHARILQITFDEQQSKNMVEYVAKILEFAKELGSIEAIQKLTDLQSLAILISISEGDFESFYSSLVGKIPDDEILKALRCRRDKEKIQRKASIFDGSEA
ncbi:hypothetical protein EHEL_040360 [Encephalitozoon hellem ATCC 50504]|uniref:Exocyst complex component Sec10-like alpha-helical bundle domain-containing protein n=1 Tax=Encephalitozoon hellem TaxID=27973 RepID=A0A9Q9C3P2_ENCHE|nr:uncharacterized protein EHEL_040360 [Encephalitozoon hellem ATCC 50504]AFM98088.1 hypothetical protein EHEL_040360 [Encephalitozoon hellem ATCC 50504]UTX42930.1 hypothetical protein GPU96_04g06600 [Encephalitozoon hellem]|eukprot:XP_003887069.1 hypothetical protein EHEL_040360 [Encephalitozoon hellem ATCC 50504]